MSCFPKGLKKIHAAKEQTLVTWTFLLCSYLLAGWQPSGALSSLHGRACCTPPLERSTWCPAWGSGWWPAFRLAGWCSPSSPCRMKQSVQIVTRAECWFTAFNKNVKKPASPPRHLFKGCRLVIARNNVGRNYIFKNWQRHANTQWTEAQMLICEEPGYSLHPTFWHPPGHSRQSKWCHLHVAREAGARSAWWSG